MKMKRFVSLVMACVMALALAVPAFAESATPAGQTVVTGVYKDIPISVLVPATGDAQINPYGLPVTINKSEGKTATLSGQQITTKPLSIKNQGATSLDVNATLAVLPKGDVVIQGAALTTSEVGKQIDVVLEVANADDETLAVSNTSEKLDDLVIDKFVADATWENAASLRAPAAAKGATSVATPAKSTQAMTVLGGVTVKSEGFTYAKDSIALFRLTGELNEVPEKTVNTNQVEDPWAEADGFEATIVFKFKPHAFVEPSVNMDNSTLTIAASGTGTLTVNYDAGDSDLTVTKYTWSSTDATKASVPAGGTATNKTATITNNAAGSATIKCVVTLSDNSELTASCDVTCS